MKKILYTLFFLGAFALTVQAQPERKVLFIGIDGLRSDAFMQANTPNLDALFQQGCYTFTSWHLGITISAPSWSDMLCGVWENKHGVTNNSYTNSDYNTYPYFVTRAKEVRPDLKAVQITSWAPMSNLVYNDGWDNKIIVGDDPDVRNSALVQLADPDLDILFTHIDNCDASGHSFQFSPTIPQYMSTIEQTDVYVGDILNALYARPGVVNGTEDWLVVLTTDHGGIGYGHGGNTLQEKQIWWAAIGSTVTPREVTIDINNPGNWFNAPMLVDIGVTALDHLLQGDNTALFAQWSLDGVSWLDNEPVGINGADLQAAGIQVFPNPNDGSFQVRMENVQGDVTIRLFDLSGKQVLETRANAVAGTPLMLPVDATALPKGLYNLQVVSEKGSANGKISVQ